MKILAIGGKNLASLTEEFRIDFRKEPLCSAGLFAITGCTGSGKTTILDAMCIALYEKTPRLESIRNGETIESFGSTRLSESDPKTILSKGAHEGYAEVEFLAVDGKEYRAKWSISRANDSANGRFRKTAYDIFNLTNGTHERYAKREYSAIVPTLVGLTYEEFTRAVLLTQGNFAAFLKAGENEKAGILQKLTGTEIYSRISSLIYSRAVETKKELDIVDAQRNSIQLLSEENIAELNAQKSELEKENKNNEKAIIRLTAEKQWVERSKLLEKEYKAAEQAYNDTLIAVERNRPLTDKLARIDSVQEIRDTYMQRTEAAKLTEENRITLVTLKEKLEKASQALLSATNQTKTAEENVRKIQQEYDEYKPNINNIIKAEETISSYQTRLKDINELLSRNEEELRKLKHSTAESHKKLEKNSQEKEDILQWFTLNKKYEHIIPNIPIITANLQFIFDTRAQISSQQKVLTDTKNMLTQSEKEFEEVKKHNDELSKTLSSEIAQLRSRLISGEPCPVCGSRVHEYSSVSEKTLAEKELEKAKEITASSIERLTHSIENYKRETAATQSIIETLSASIQSIRERNVTLMNSLEHSLTIVEDNKSVTMLQSLANEWERKSKRLITIKEEVSVTEKSIELSTARINTLTRETEESRAQILAINSCISKEKERLTTLLGKWESREKAEEYFAKAIADANKAFSTASEEKAANAGVYHRLKGNIEEKENLFTAQKKRETELSAKISAYLEARSDGMNYEELNELLSPANNVAEMRSTVEKAKNNALKATATLNERKRNKELHEADKEKPQGNPAIEELLSAIDSVKQQQKSTLESINNINATLLKNNENIEEFSKFREIFENKQKIAADWAALNSIFGSANGDKLTRLTQGYTLDILLDVANMHLREFSGRYILSRISDDSLGIKVIDLEMMSDSRSVHTLSGGETFLASLALSLALSSVSSNKMDIETLFIDEGFGALDSDTLKEAISVLEKLQSKGRKIGIISHLSEMLERIPTKIKVVKRGNGKSRIITE